MDDDITDYVRATARLLGLALDEPQVQRVAAHLLRTRALAASLDAVPLGADDEIAEIFRPAPFPAEDAQ